ncbi:MFS transporter [Paludibaculum fermentans]|uniref:MFS transporter n=1 Tax=Paludibaculum fermentans TaxID=1473598 RepID=A0A7S7NK84_PALFE|nr:MFS transporter [Paludibaculum fermentans]QOY85142.1 MFS transporter [Paludibaculum fermentans]
MPSTPWRHWVPAASMLLVSLISYIDRNTLALLAPTILRDNQLSAEQYGWIISSFSVAYMLGNPLWGRWLDRWGVRVGMLAAVAFWTLSSTAHAFVSGFLGFAVARAALGFGEGATFPGGLRTVVQTLPDRLRSRGVALAYSGGSLGAVLTPLIVTPIYQAYGWRAAFLFTGFVGALWLVAWLFISRRPELRATQPQPVDPATPSPASRPAMKWSDPRLWSFMSSYALGCLPLAFVLYEAPIYFVRALGKSQVEIGHVLWIPPLGWECGYFLWGWFADRLRKNRPDPMPVYRALTLAALVMTLPLALGARIQSFPVLLFLLFWTMFVAGGNVIVAISYATHTFTTANAGLIAGLGAGSWSAFVALSMPGFGHLMDARSWDAAFLGATLVPVVGYSGWLWINRGSNDAALPAHGQHQVG